MDARFESRPIYLDAQEFRREAGETWFFPLHRHEMNMELLFIAEGQCSYTINGKRYRAGAGDVVLFHPNVWHEERSDPSGPFQFYYVGFHSLQFRGLPEFRLYASEGEEAPLFSAAHRYDRIHYLFRELCEEGGAGWPEPLSGVDIALERLLLEVRRTMVHPSSHSSRPSAQGLVNKVRRIIEERYREPLTIRQLAEEVYISGSYLSHIFQRQVGQSPVQYVIRQRMNSAKRCLATTDLSIAAIAQEIGYESATAFQCLFKKAVGVTPGQYRKERKSNQNGTDYYN